METIPALMEERPLEATLPGGRGTVHLIGGKRIWGDVQLTANWVVVTLDGPDESGAGVRVLSALTVISIDFTP